MLTHKFWGILQALYGIIFLISCGNGGLDVLLSSSRIYQVNAYINEYSLNERSIIRQNDIIRPYFANSVLNDPDIRGLTIFLQTPSGQLAGKKISYILEGFNKTGITEVEIPGSSEPEGAAGSSGTPNPETSGLPEDKEFPEEGPAGAEPEESPDPQAEPQETSASPVLANPGEPLTVPPVEDTPPQRVREPAAPPVLEDQVILVASLDRNLPPFQIVETLEIGEYFMIFQILGEKDILHTIERPVYFLGNAALAFDDIQRYLPSLSSNPHFLPPGMNILLEARILSDKRLDPYIIWYNGERPIGEGKLFEGAHCLIWKVPEQTGFHTVKAMIFPFKPSGTSTSNGIVKELSLPVSSKSRGIAYFSKQADRFIYWYQFQSNLLDSKVPADGRRGLQAIKNRPPQWLPHGGIYGLSVGPGDIFMLPREVSFMVAQGAGGTGQILFHLAPLSRGTVFKAAFVISDKPFLSPSDTLDMSLSLGDGKLLLTLSLGDLSYQEAIDLEGTGTDNFITPSITFGIQRERFTAHISLEETEGKTKPISLFLPHPLTGEGTFQLGAEPGARNKPVAIFNELGFAFTKGSLPLESDPETAPPEELAAEFQGSASPADPPA